MPLWSLLIIVSPALLVGFAPLSTVVYCSATGITSTRLDAANNSGTIRITGGLDQSMVHMVTRAIAESHTPIHLVLLNSFGGQTEAMQDINQLLRPLHPEIMVPAGATCQSACIGVLADASNGFSISATATLMFHSAADRVGFTSTGLCGCLNRVSAYVTTLVRKRSGRTPDMLPWAQALSNRLPVLFAACPVNPLYTMQGLTLTGAEFNNLRAGALQPRDLLSHCPS